MSSLQSVIHVMIEFLLIFSEANFVEVPNFHEICKICSHQKRCSTVIAKIAQRIMAPLPLNGITTSLRAFTRVAVDCGVLFMTVQGRGKPRQKR